MIDYKNFPYFHGPVPVSHPMVEVPRVLEIGCGVGNNAAEIARKFPNTSVMAFDIEPDHIAVAKENHKDLKNLTFHVHDLNVFIIDEEKFDWIIAHGVLSWIDPKMWEMFFTQFRYLLTDTGVGFISYNTMPGCANKMALRAILLNQTKRFHQGVDQMAQARAVLKMLAKQTTALGTAAREAVDQPDWFIAHDLLEEHNHPLWFEDFVELLEQNNLEYMGDVQPHSSLPDDPVLSKQLISIYETNTIRLEAVVDWVRNRAFRQSLIRKKV